MSIDQAAQDAIEGRSGWRPARRPVGGGFAAQIGAWANNVIEAQEAVFKNAAQRLVKELQAELNVQVYDGPPSPSGYVRTGFLRASLVASTEAMPRLIRENPGVTVTADEMGPIILTINGWDTKSTLFVGYTSAYAGFVHFGAGGATPRPWVTLTAQKWPQIVREEAAKVKAAFGL